MAVGASEKRGVLGKILNKKIIILGIIDLESNR
jgi:hypothetical protein